MCLQFNKGREIIFCSDGAMGDKKSNPVLFVATCDPAGVATFWLPAPGRPSDPANPGSKGGLWSWAASLSYPTCRLDIGLSTLLVTWCRWCSRWSRTGRGGSAATTRALSRALARWDWAWLLPTSCPTRQPLQPSLARLTRSSIRPPTAKQGLADQGSHPLAETQQEQNYIQSSLLVLYIERIDCHLLVRWTYRNELIEKGKESLED